MNPEQNPQNMLNFLKIVNRLLDNKVFTIFEFGARDGKETIIMAKEFPKAKIYTFECNSQTISICKKTLSKFRNVILTEKAVGNFSGVTDFYPIDTVNTITNWKDGNPGASSLFKANKHYPAEKYKQLESKVEIIRPDKFIDDNKIIMPIDILWMDIQGAELLAIEGFGHYLTNIKIIHTEVEFFEIYNSQPLFPDINKYLIERGFMLYTFTSFNRFSGDAVYINSKYIASWKNFIPTKIVIIIFQIKMLIDYIFGNFFNLK